MRFSSKSSIFFKFYRTPYFAFLTWGELQINDGERPLLLDGLFESVKGGCGFGGPTDNTECRAREIVFTGEQVTYDRSFALV